LTISSRIIVSGTDGLRDGDRVRVTGEDAMLGSSGQMPQGSGAPDTMNRLPTGDDQ